MGPFQGSKKKNGSVHFFPHPLGHEKKANVTHIRKIKTSLKRPLETTQQKDLQRPQKKMIKIQFHNCHRLKPLKFKMMGFGKSEKKHITPQAFLSPSFFPRKGTGNICIYFRVKRLKMCGLWSVFGVD